MIAFSVRPCVAVIARHLLELKNAFELFMVSYWCFFDLFSFGLLAASFKHQNALQYMTTNMALWYLVARGSIGFAVSFVRDLHTVTFVSMMTTPLTLLEWFVALITMGIINGLLGFFMSALAAVILFEVNVFSSGWIIIPAAISLLWSGCVLGTLVLSLVFTFGRRAESLVWIAGYFLAPFSGVFCPVANLPVVLQKIAAWLPTSYVFACFGAGRSGQIDTPAQLLCKSFALNGCYFALALALFYWRFTQRRSTGLTRLEVEL